jgi:hypothetical protein
VDKFLWRQARRLSYVAGCHRGGTLNINSGNLDWVRPQSAFNSSFAMAAMISSATCW